LDFDLIIINFNTPQLTIDCIESAYASYPRAKFNVIVVDNASSDNSLVLIKSKFPNITLVSSPYNLGYAGAINLGASHSVSDILILSNSDIIFLENSFRKLIEPINLNRADICGPQQLYPNYKWQESFGIFPGLKLAILDLLLVNTIRRSFLRKFFNWKSTKLSYKYVDFVDGAIIACSKSIFDSVNGFDTDFSFYSEETAFCYSAKLMGAKIMYVPDSVLIHYRGASYGPSKIPIDYIEKMIHSKIKFCNKFLNRTETRWFCILEKWHFLVLHILNKFFKPLDPKYGNNYLEIYKIWGKIQNEI